MKHLSARQNIKPGQKPGFPVLAIMLALLLVTPLGCSKKKSSSGGDSQPQSTTAFDGSGQVATWSQYEGQNVDLLQLYLTPQDFALETGIPLTTEQISQKMIDASGTFRVATHSKLNKTLAVALNQDLAAEYTVCFQALLDSQLYRAEGEEFSLNIDIDASECLAILYRNSSTIDRPVTRSFRLRASFYGRCSAQSMKEIDGRPYDALLGKEAEFAELCRSYSSFAHNISYIFTVTYADATNPITIESTQNYAIMDAKGRSCQRWLSAGIARYENDCMYAASSINRYTTNNGTTDVAQYYRMFSRDFTEKPGSSWPDSGQFLVEIDGWQGELTFQGGEVAPTFELRRDEQTITGHFPTVAPLQLTDNGDLDLWARTAMRNLGDGMANSWRELVELEKLALQPR